MRMTLLALCACAQTLPRVDGTTTTAAAIDALAQHELATHHVTGASITLFAHGVPVFARSYGNLHQDSAMQAASLTKAAFAYCVMTLVADHVIELDHPIADYLPDPPAAFASVTADPRWQLLTPRILLSHTGGFANFAYLEDDGVLKFHFTPGTRYAYSGQGLQLLQAAIEAVMHRPLDQIMQARVFAPLGMPRTSMIWRPELGDVIGYDEAGQALEPRRRRRPDAAGSMYTTPADYARLLSHVILHPPPEMLAPQIRIRQKHQFPTLDGETTTANDAIELAYGLGWGVYTTPYGKAFFKAGHDDGWRHYAVGFANGSGLLIMTNSSNGEAIYRALLEQVLGNRFTPMEWEGF